MGWGDVSPDEPCFGCGGTAGGHTTDCWRYHATRMCEERDHYRERAITAERERDEARHGLHQAETAGRMGNCVGCDAFQREREGGELRTEHEAGCCIGAALYGGSGYDYALRAARTALAAMSARAALLERVAEATTPARGPEEAGICSACGGTGYVEAPMHSIEKLITRSGDGVGVYVCPMCGTGKTPGEGSG